MRGTGDRRRELEQCPLLFREHLEKMRSQWSPLAATLPFATTFHVPFPVIVMSFKNYLSEKIHFIRLLILCVVESIKD